MEADPRRMPVRRRPTAVRDAGDPRGPGSRRRVRLGERPDLPDRDLRAARGRPAEAWDYARGGNPTREAFQQALAALEGAARGFAFSSGLAAETTLLLTLRPGDHVMLGERRLRRDIPSARERCCRSGAVVRRPSIWPTSTCRSRRRDPSHHEARVGRDPVEPDAEDRRHRRGRRRRARGGRARRGGQHVRDAGAAASARARRRRRRPQRDEVPRRALRPDRRRDRHERRRVDRAARRSSRTRWARCPGRWTATSRCAA